MGYSLPVRQQYLNLDRMLIASARLVETGIRASGRSYALETDTSGPTKDGIVMVLRQYSPGGTLLSRSPSDPGLPPSDPQAPLTSPAKPAYYAVLPLPFGEVSDPRSNTAFGIMTVNGQRWRRYVIAVSSPTGANLGYVEALTPLGLLDSSARQLLRVLLTVTALSVLAVFLFGWWLAGSVLRPVEKMTAAATGITSSRDLEERIPTGRRGDELGRLALTFNEMLGSLQTAWHSQQRFVGDASHELRAPLTVLRGNAELLRRHPHLPPEERDEMLAELEKEASRMARLLDDLLLLAQSDAGSTLQRSPLSLRTVTAEAIRAARRLSAAHTTVLQAGEDPTVWGEKDRLRQLLLILLDNALKYSPAGSSVIVTVRRQERWVTLSVQDEGRGIAPEDLPHIFERFYRADKARSRQAGGVGLGLSIAHWIAEQLGAALWVETTGPQGTTFMLRLEAAPT